MNNTTKDSFQKLLSQLDLELKNESLFEQAFTHRSYLNEAGKSRQSNERLEFLGDAILSHIVSQYLYSNYPEYSEGRLTHLRSTIVKTETLAEIASSLQFGKYLLLSKGEDKGGGRTNKSLLADTFEAVIGAVYLDSGFDQVKRFLEKVLFAKVDDIIRKEIDADYKSKLQEMVQITSDIPPTYKVIKTEGPDHNKQFWVAVVIDGVEGETGMGKSKQEAEQNAAARELEKMGKL
jgi:ribonuclease-3